MNSQHTTRRWITALTASVALSALLAPLPSAAREGGSSTSVGKGIKCRTVVTTDPVTGKVTVTKVCTKGV